MTNISQTAEKMLSDSVLEGFKYPIVEEGATRGTTALVF
jgi:hypothetical protein